MRASRLMTILMVLQTRGRVSARSLAQRLEVSVRTIYRDIDELSAAGVPVIVQRGAAGGFELLEGWRTTLTGLTAAESQALFLSGLPGPVEQLGLADTMASAQLKLLAALPREWQPQAQHVASRFHVDLTSWYRRVGPVAHLRTLADAVWADRRVTVQYESWKRVVERELEPLGLVVKAGEWYLVAQPRRTAATQGQSREPRTYKVASIRALTVGAAFTRPRRLELATYWTDSTRRFERELHRSSAVVRLSPRGRQLLGGTSTAIKEAIERAVAAAPDADWLVVTIPIESLAHATHQLLGLAADAEVLAPPALRDLLLTSARAVVARYSGDAQRASRP